MVDVNEWFCFHGVASIDNVVASATRNNKRRVGLMRACSSFRTKWKMTCWMSRRALRFLNRECVCFFLPPFWSLASFCVTTWRAGWVMMTASFQMCCNGYTGLPSFFFFRPVRPIRPDKKTTGSQLHSDEWNPSLLSLFLPSSVRPSVFFFFPLKKKTFTNYEPCCESRNKTAARDDIPSAVGEPRRWKRKQRDATNWRHIPSSILL